MALACVRRSLFAAVLLALPSPALPASLAAGLAAHQARDPPSLEDQAAADAQNAKAAAESAQTAAQVAKQVAAHSVHVTRHAQAALRKAREALHGARVETEGLSKEQKRALTEAEAHLREASETANYGHHSKTQEEEALEEKLKALKANASANATQTSEIEEMRKDLRSLRERLKGTNEEKTVEEIDGMLEDLEDKDETDGMSHDELKAELERLREAVKRIEEKEAEEKQREAMSGTEDGGGRRRAHTAENKAEIKTSEELTGEADEEGTETEEDATGPGGAPGSEDGEWRVVRKPRGGDFAKAAPGEQLDVDTQMPFGDLEPFGREDTAQELTEASILESDKMVDQLERAQVAEEKRAVFRALTRLRGAAITSFDGVARAQTGSIDEYNERHKWRDAHPLHHLAQEESDVSKWAFPNADF